MGLSLHSQILKFREFFHLLVYNIIIIYPYVLAPVSGVGRFLEVVRPTKAAHAQKSYTARRKARLRMRMLDASFPDLYTGAHLAMSLSRKLSLVACCMPSSVFPRPVYPVYPSRRIFI